MFEFILGIITSDKFYLPVIFTAVGVISYQFLSYTIRKVNKINTKFGKMQPSKGYNKRKSTVVGLINNIIKYIIAIIVIIAILNVYGVNTDKIIASLGIASVVVGLAFQDIIKDLLAGIFIVFDNAYAVGDWVTVDGFKGEVISMGLKTTKIRAYTGEVMILANSTFSKVVNYNLSSPKIFIEIPFSYDVKIEKMEELLSNVLVELKKDKDVKSFQLLGIESFDDGYIHYAIEVDCVVSTQFRIKRLLLKKLKMTFDENDIDIPYNKLGVQIEK